MSTDKQMRVLYVARGRSRAEELSSQNQLLGMLGRHFEHNGAQLWQWDTVTSQKAALRIARLASPQLVFIAVDNSSGRLSFCNAMRRRLPSARLIAVVEQSQTTVAACDALLQVPLHAPEVTAVLTRLLTNFRGHQFQQGPILLDMDMRTVVTPKGQYHMTPKQAQLLYFFLVNHNQVLSRRDIMQQVWDTSFLEDTRTLDVHIRWLRERIELNPSDPSYLVTVRGRGYRLSLE